MATVPYTRLPANSAEDIRSWYAAKTCWLLDKYGPGPRVHFHTGLVSPEEHPAPTAALISRQLVEGQERMLQRALESWRVEQTFRGPVLDVGCGLGGSALWFAQRVGCRVTALSNVPEHLAHVERFAAEAGLSGRVVCEEGDAHHVRGEARFEAAYCIDASNYFDRRRWFEVLSRVLRPGGHVGIEDTFQCDAESARHFNAYWLSNVGTRVEYEQAAADAGFELVHAADVTGDSARWYDLSVAHSRALVREQGLTGAALAARERSIQWQSEFAEGYRDRKFEDLLLLFRLRD